MIITQKEIDEYLDKRKMQMIISNNIAKYYGIDTDDLESFANISDTRDKELIMRHENIFIKNCDLDEIWVEEYAETLVIIDSTINVLDISQCDINYIIIINSFINNLSVKHVSNAMRPIIISNSHIEEFELYNVVFEYEAYIITLSTIKKINLGYVYDSSNGVIEYEYLEYHEPIAYLLGRIDD